MRTKATSIFNNPDVAKTLSTIHDNYVVVPADQAPDNIMFVCKRHYIDCLTAELGVGCTSKSTTYTATTLSKKGGNHQKS